VKLLVLGINYNPELTGIAVYNAEMCEYLVSKGHEVHILTGFPYYPFGSRFFEWYEKYKGFRFFVNEKINGVDVMRVNLYRPKKVNTIKRIFHEASFVALSLIRLICSAKKYSMILCISPPLLSGIVAYIISNVKKVPYIFHIQDMQPDAAVELGMLKNRMLIKFLYFIEKFIYKNAAYVLTISEGMRKKIIDKGFNPDNVGIFYNWADMETYKETGEENLFKEKYGLADKFVVLHVGNMGEKQDMKVIMDTAKMMKDDPSVRFLLGGRGSKRVFVERYISEYSLGNVVLLDVQPKSLIGAMFHCADAALITQTAKVKNIVMPSKIFGPASAGKPLIIAATENCEISRITRKYKFGMVISPEKPEELRENIYKLKKNKEVAERLGENGRSFMINERSKEKIINEFEKKYLMQLG